jgi:hypothetical protein
MTLADDTRRAAVDVAAAAIAPILAGTTLRPVDVAETALAAAGYPSLPAPELFTVERWRIVLPVATVKGISEADARRLAALCGGTAERSTVTLLDDGTELLGPWQPEAAARDVSAT